MAQVSLTPKTRPIAPLPNLPFSPEQLAYFHWLQHSTGSAILSSVAGSGKTTTLVAGLHYMRGPIFIGVFNKRIAEELQSKIPTGCATISTMHSAGFGVWRNYQSRCKVDSNKCKWLLKDHFPAIYKEDWRLITPILQLVSLAKQAGVGVGGYTLDREGWESLIDLYSIYCHSKDEVVLSVAPALLELSQQDLRRLDFDDMIYMPLFHKVVDPQYDWVLIDEAQDTNRTRRLLAVALLRPTGRLVAVGDPHQAIYGFTGADSNAMSLLRDAVRATELSLSVSYRCPQAVVAEAQNYVPHISPSPDAPLGNVSKITYPDMFDNVGPGDVILCRNNAPLLEAAFSLINSGVPVKIEGKDLGAKLQDLVARWDSRDLEYITEKLVAYRDERCNKYIRTGRRQLAEDLADRVACIFTIMNRVYGLCDTPNGQYSMLLSEIDNIFGDSVGPNYVCLSTIHKAKGREWPKVYWLRLPISKYVTKDWEYEAEDNIAYVAITRAMEELNIIEMEK